MAHPERASIFRRRHKSAETEPAQPEIAPPVTAPHERPVRQPASPAQGADIIPISLARAAAERAALAQPAAISQALPREEPLTIPRRSFWRRVKESLGITTKASMTEDIAEMKSKLKQPGSNKNQLDKTAEQAWLDTFTTDDHKRPIVRAAYDKQGRRIQDLSFAQPAPKFTPLLNPAETAQAALDARIAKADLRQAHRAYQEQLTEDIMVAHGARVQAKAEKKAKELAAKDERVYTAYDKLPKSQTTQAVEAHLDEMLTPDITIELGDNDIEMITPEKITPPPLLRVNSTAKHETTAPADADDYAEITIENPVEERELAYLRTVAEKFTELATLQDPDPNKTMAFQDWLVQNKAILPLSEEYLTSHPDMAHYLQKQNVDLTKLKSILPPAVDFA